MNTQTFAAITNVGIVSVTGFAVWASGSAWGLLGLLFLLSITAKKEN